MAISEARGVQDIWDRYERVKRARKSYKIAKQCFKQHLRPSSTTTVNETFLLTMNTNNSLLRANYTSKKAYTVGARRNMRLTEIALHFVRAGPSAHTEQSSDTCEKEFLWNMLLCRRRVVLFFFALVRALPCGTLIDFNELNWLPL